MTVMCGSDGGDSEESTSIQPAHHAAPEAGSAGSGAVVLEVRSLRHVYGATIALAGVDLCLRAGEIHGLVGQNGAGKSTLIRILAGLEPPDSGEIIIQGETISALSSSADATKRGLAFLHQSFGLVESVSILDNICLVTGYIRRGGRISWKESAVAARRTLARVGLEDVDLSSEAGQLPLSQQAAIAIARALQLHAKILVLDEPTSALQEHEVEVLFEIVRNLATEGVSCLFVSHRMDEVMALCDQVTVFRDGLRVASMARAAFTEARLVDLIAGIEQGKGPDMSAPGVPTAPPVPGAPDREPPRSNTPRLSIHGLRSASVGPIDVRIDPGRIVGVTGLADSGHLKLAAMIAGLEPSMGLMELDGVPFKPTSVSHALSCAVAYVPPDRLVFGLAGGLSLRENLFMNPSQPWYRPIHPHLELQRARDILRDSSVRPEEPEREVSTLSGGNQQKLLLAKWLSIHPRLVLLCEATAGVDVGAKRDIYNMLRARCADEGLAVVMASSDFVEMSDACDEVLVLARGSQISLLCRPDITVAAITRAAYSSPRQVREATAI